MLDVQVWFLGLNVLLALIVTAALLFSGWSLPPEYRAVPNEDGTYSIEKLRHFGNGVTRYRPVFSTKTYSESEVQTVLRNLNRPVITLKENDQ